MRNKILTLLVLLLTVVTGAQADNEAQARIGSTEYATLQEAFDNAKTHQIIRLLSDVGGVNQIGDGKVVTLNLNGHIISNPQADALVANGAGTEITIKDYSNGLPGGVIGQTRGVDGGKINIMKGRFNYNNEDAATLLGKLETIGWELPKYYTVKDIDGGPDKQGFNVRVEHIYVASIGSTKYTSLSEAAMKAKNGQTVKMLADISSDDSESDGFWAENGRSLTLDLNGHVLARSDGAIIGAMGQGSLVTIIDSSSGTPGGVIGLLQGAEGGKIVITAGRYNLQGIDAATILSYLDYLGWDIPNGYNLEDIPDGPDAQGFNLRMVPLLNWNADTNSGAIEPMPAADLDVEIEFYSLGTVTLDVTGNGGTASLLDSTFKPLSATKILEEGDRFVMLVNKDDDIGYNVTPSTGGYLDMEEFSSEDYERYMAYARENNITVPANTILKWVTMPDTDDADLVLTVAFNQMETYAVLYQPASGTNPDIVFCCMELKVNGKEEVTYAALQRGAMMGDGAAVWTMKMAAAFAPTKIAFVTAAVPKTPEEEDNLASDLEYVDLYDATISQNTNSWNSLSGAKYLIIGGNAKVVTAAFIADPNSTTVYRDYAVDAATTKGGVTCQIAVCLTDEQGRVTTPGTVKAPAAPKTIPVGKKFGGWRGFQYDSNGRSSEKIYAANEANISVRDNVTFSAVWTPIQVTTLFAMNGGTGVSNPTTRDYGQTLGDIGEPTRTGCVLDYWVVMKAVNESGVHFGKGSKFNTNTPLTANLQLWAKWKHVHKYVSYAIESIPEMEKYMKYNKVMHITACDCEDMYTAQHEFNPAGRCVCGYEKPGAAQVQVDIAYGKMEGNTFTTLSLGLPEFPMRGQEIKVEAFPNWGDLEFKKWQYSTDGGQTWDDLAAFEIVGFLVPCNMKVRALYVNPVTTPTIELTSRQYDDKAEYEGKTYTMDNILYQTNYKLPDGYKLLDAGIRMGDNNGISYYFVQDVTYKSSAEAKGIMAGITAGVVGLGVVSTYFLGAGGGALDVAIDGAKALMAKEDGIRYLETEENVLEKKMNAASLAKYMYDGDPVNVPKYDPVYWDAHAKTKGLSGTVSSLPPLRFAQRNNQEHYIYGIGYMRYMTPNGEEKSLYTDAIAATVNNPDHYTSKSEDQANNARLMTASGDAATTSAAKAAGLPSVTRKAPKRESEQQQEAETLDISTVTAPQTQLTVFVDGEYDAALSDPYGCGETVTLTAPAVAGKTFSYWTAEGAVISTSPELTLTMNANTMLRAVYDAATVPAASAAGILSVTRSTDGQKIAVRAIANGTFDTAGIVYSTTATEPTINGDGVTNVAAVLYSSLTTELPASVLDKNNCWTLQITPDDETTVYYIRAYTTAGGNTTYSDVKSVTLADVKSGLKMVANLEAFEPGFDDALAEVSESLVFSTSYKLTLAEGSDAHGTVAFTIGNETLTEADKDDVVTLTVVPDENYLVTEVTAEAYTTWNGARRSAPDDIPVYGDIELTPVEGVANAWTFTMPAANVEVTVAYAKVHTVHVRAGRFATFYADENIKLATETPQGVTLHTITSVTNTEAVVSSAIEGIVAAGTPLLVYNDTDTDQDVTIIPTAEQPINGLIWDEKFKGTAEDKTFDDAAMQSADYYVLSGGKNFAVVLGAGTLAANQCWLQFDKDQSAGARSVNIVFGETTKIDSVESGEQGVERWHDLQGRKVKMPTKPGVYIKKNKKVVIK